MRRIIFLLALAVAAAGCTMPGQGGDTTTTTTSTPPTTTTTTTTTPPTTTTPAVNDTTLTNSTWTLNATGIPAQAKPGARFNFTLAATGTVTRASDHIGAHYADNATPSPSAATMQACDHQAGQLPGTFNVTCTLSTEGTWYVFGHAQASEGGQLYNYWALPSAVKVRNYTLNLTGAPSTPVTSNQSFTVSLNVTGKENATSDHIGAHVFNATTDNPTVAGSAGACAHLAGGVVSTHAIECRIVNTGAGPKTYFVYGHVRITEGGVTLDWWSPPIEVQVLGTAGLPI